MWSHTEERQFVSSHWGHWCQRRFTGRWIPFLELQLFVQQVFHIHLALHQNLFGTRHAPGRVKEKKRKFLIIHKLKIQGPKIIRICQNLTRTQDLFWKGKLNHLQFMVHTEIIQEKLMNECFSDFAIGPTKSSEYCLKCSLKSWML